LGEGGGSWLTAESVERGAIGEGENRREGEGEDRGEVCSSLHRLNAKKWWYMPNSGDLVISISGSFKNRRVGDSIR